MKPYIVSEQEKLNSPNRRVNSPKQNHNNTLLSHCQMIAIINEFSKMHIKFSEGRKNSFRLNSLY